MACTKFDFVKINLKNSRKLKINKKTKNVKVSKTLIDFYAKRMEQFIPSQHPLFNYLTRFDQENDFEDDMDIDMIEEKTNEIYPFLPTTNCPTCNKKMIIQTAIQYISNQNPSPKSIECDNNCGKTYEQSDCLIYSCQHQNHKYNLCVHCWNK